VPAQPRTEVVAITDPIIEKAVAATQRARVSMIRKYTKKHDIQHFDIGAIVSIKVPQEDRTSTDNKRLFARILEEPYPHRYQVLTPSGIIQRLIPTKSLGVVDQALWSDILIPTSTKQVRLAAREASTSARVGISCQCKGQCSTKRCRCYKETKECSVHCHNDDHDCGNLSGLAIRTEIVNIVVCVVFELVPEKISHYRGYRQNRISY
jgi:stage V sporulation protein SpoVS